MSYSSRQSVSRGCREEVGAEIEFLGYSALPHGHKKVRHTRCLVGDGRFRAVGLQRSEAQCLS